MKEITLEELLEAGCHFGHQVTRHNPKAREFIFEARDGIHIIDLAKTKEGLDEAAAYLKSVAAKLGSTLLVVGTKRQVQNIVLEEVGRARNTIEKDGSKEPTIFYVNNRWLGGTLSNFAEVSKNYKKLKDYSSRLKNEEEKARFTKKEVGQWEKARQKLQNLYGGVVEMKKLPDVLFIIDTHLEKLAVSEARRMKIPTTGIVDTNADPAAVDFPIPANDDAVGSLKLIVGNIINAWIAGKTEKVEEKKEEPAEKKPAKASEKKNEEIEGTGKVKVKKPRKKKEEASEK